MITKEIIAELSSDKISKPRYKEIIQEVNRKVDEIWQFICSSANRELHWWAFQNDTDYGEGCGSSGGSFDPDTDAVWIYVQGEFESCRLVGYEYNEGFPTNLLWAKNYQEVVLKHLLKCKRATKAKKEHAAQMRSSRKEKRLLLMESIKRKLTPEEWAVVKKVFK